MKKRVWAVTNYGVSIYPLCMLGEVLYYDFHKLAGKNFFPAVGEFTKSVNHWAIMPGSRQKINELILPKALKDKKWTAGIIKKIYLTSNELLNFTKKIFKADLTKKTDKQLLQLYQQYNQKFKTMYLYGWLPNALEGENDNFSTKLEMVLLAKLKKAW